jgi:hypothetical protein
MCPFHPWVLLYTKQLPSYKCELYNYDCGRCYAKCIQSQGLLYRNATDDCTTCILQVNYNPTSGNGILYDNNYCNNYYSSWDSWGRWVTLAVVISSILVFGLLFTYLRRRRRLQAVNQVQMMPMPQQPTQPPPGYYGQPYSPYSTSPPNPTQSGPVTGYPVEPGPGMSDPYGHYGKPPT